MDTVRLQHPNLNRVIEVPASAVGQHAVAGWVPAEGEPAPLCPTCRQPWQIPQTEPPPEAEPDIEAPAQAGASSSQPPKRRRKSEESE